MGLNESMAAVQKSTMNALGLEAEFFKLPLKNPFSQLLHFLAEPNADKMAGLMLARLLSWFDRSKMSATDDIDATRNRIEGVAPGAYMPILEAMPKQLLCGGMQHHQIRVDCLMPPQALSELAPEKVLVSVTLDDHFVSDESIGKGVWHGYLSLFNLLQFMPLTLLSTSTGAAAGLYESIVWRSDTPPEASDAAIDVALKEVMGEVDASLHDGLKRLNDLRCDVPEVGYELMNLDGEVVGDAIELAWLDLKVLGIVEGADSPALPDGESWHIVVLDEQGQWADTVASLVKGES